MRFIIGVVLLAVSGLAHAQSLAVVPSCGAATYSAGQSKPGTQDTTGNACVNSSGGGGGGSPVVPTPPTGGATQSAVSCATSTTTLLAASTATFPPVIRNEQSNTNPVWVNIAGNAATAAVPNIELMPGQEIDTSALAFTPTSAYNCIAPAGATSLTLVYR